MCSMTGSRSIMNSSRDLTCCVTPAAGRSMAKACGPRSMWRVSLVFGASTRRPRIRRPDFQRGLARSNWLRSAVGGTCEPLGTRHLRAIARSCTACCRAIGEALPPVPLRRTSEPPLPLWSHRAVLKRGRRTESTFAPAPKNSVCLAKPSSRPVLTRVCPGTGAERQSAHRRTRQQTSKRSA